MTLGLQRAAPKSGSRLRWFGVGLIVFSVLTMNTAMAGAIINPGSTFTGGSLSALAVSLYLPATRTAIASSPVAANFYTPGGVLAGTVALTTNATGGISLPPPPIPAGATADGGYVKLSVGPYGVPPRPPLKVSWSTSAWTFLGLSTGFQIDPLGLPGVTPNQSWNFVNPTGASGTLTLLHSSVIPPQQDTFYSSNFDLSYSLVSSGVYAASITGNDSYIQLVDSNSLAAPELADNALIAFEDGSSFGTIQYLTSTTGTFDFSAIGMSGTWSYDSGANFTTATVTSAEPFDALAIASSEVPEPSTVTLVGTGVIGLLGCTWRRSRYSIMQR